ncbi:MAG: molybdate ABC transporter substrate-binding protein [Bryobacteraceae bacterium]
MEPAKITVAAASNLTGVFDEMATAFRNSTSVEVVLSYGSTAQLTQQIENGAPFDVFAAADAQHIDQLVGSGKLRPDSRLVYARGQLALWAPETVKFELRTLNDLLRPEVRVIAIAEPELAPYGKAAVEAMKAAGLWDRVQPKIVYASNINMARQYATTGNADVAFTAYSLVLKDPGKVIRVDAKLYSPIDQALGVVAASAQQNLAKQFTAFVVAAQGKQILRKSGYTIP